MGKIIGNTTATPTPRSDWNQTNENKADFIQNKPTLGALSAKDTVELTDLAMSVQTSLGKADSAMQSFTETDPTVPEWAKADTKPSYSYSEITDTPTKVSDFTNDAGYAVLNDLPSWSKENTKPTYNVSEISGAVAYTAQSLTEDQKAQVRSNIGAGDSSFSGNYSDLKNIPPHDYIPNSEKGTANGVAQLDASGKVPTAQLPSYVDDVLEYEKYASLPNRGEEGKIYVDKTTNKTYRWGGSSYVEISASLAIGETSSTAYRGDYGKAAYTHSTTTSGNPHKVTKSEVGLGNVDNVKQYSSSNPPPYPVTSVAGKGGAVTLAKADVGLSNVANTGDSATPVSGGTTKFTTGGAYTELAKKVDKVAGKGLSTNDYTTTEKNKLAGIESGANAYSHPATHAAGMITGLSKVATSGSYNDLTNKPTIPTSLSALSDDATHRVVTDAEKSAWNAKSNFSGNYNDLTNKPTIPTSMTVDSALSNTSTNPVQNKVINSALAGYIPTSQKGATNGVSTLDASGKVPTSQLPTNIVTNIYIDNDNYLVVTFINGTTNKFGPITGTSCAHANKITLQAVDATCATPGLTAGVQCKDCNAIITPQTVIPATGNHTYDNDHDATCNVCGHTRVVDCQHTNTTVLPAVAATCAKTGLTEGRKCADCGVTLVAQTTIPKLAHTEVTIPAVAATCTTAGKTEGKRCSVCNTVTVAPQAIAALGHTGEWVITKSPTCTEEGTKQRICTRCGVVEEQTIAMTDHVYVDGVCSCGAVKSDSIVEASIDEDGILTMRTQLPWIRWYDIFVYYEDLGDNYGFDYGVKAYCNVPGDSTNGTDKEYEHSISLTDVFDYDRYDYPLNGQKLYIYVKADDEETCPYVKIETNWKSDWMGRDYNLGQPEISFERDEYIVVTYQADDYDRPTHYDVYIDGVSVAYKDYDSGFQYIDLFCDGVYPYNGEDIYIYAIIMEDGRIVARGPVSNTITYIGGGGGGGVGNAPTISLNGDILTIRGDNDVDIFNVFVDGSRSSDSTPAVNGTATYDLSNLGLSPGSYYIQVMATYAGGDESDLSAGVTYIVH